MITWLMAEHVPPFTADALVFGQRDPSGPQFGGMLGPLRDCRVHEVTWRGPVPCWLCEAAS